MMFHLSYILSSCHYVDFPNNLSTLNILNTPNTLIIPIIQSPLLCLCGYRHQAVQACGEV